MCRCGNACLTQGRNKIKHQHCYFDVFRDKTEDISYFAAGKILTKHEKKKKRSLINNNRQQIEGAYISER